MSYAVRNDRRGLRAVNGPEDVGPGEFFSEIIVDIEPPAKTYKTELAEVNSSYQSDVDAMNKAFAIAYLADGASQEEKQAAIRAQYQSRKAQHAVEIQALKTKYNIGV
ncbi:hypothetical protein GO594_01795 [Pseudomonas otitidis]|uniref:Uncharacterized protein n=1 Tax=Metapseudomonas otitidis TaxID=319939 RepID=A0A7X3H3I2_9GAMM|nr:hypothetical protein [Pseudomonas otitidis]MWK54699.1 hypothetical protein [Pseudomonas otitidis]